MEVFTPVSKLKHGFLTDRDFRRLHRGDADSHSDAIGLRQFEQRHGGRISVGRRDVVAMIDASVSHGSSSG